MRLGFLAGLVLLIVAASWWATRQNVEAPNGHVPLTAPGVDGLQLVAGPIAESDRDQADASIRIASSSTSAVAPDGVYQVSATAFGRHEACACGHDVPVGSLTE